MKTNLKFLLPLLFLITAVIPVFAAFPGSGTREQSREIDLIRENSELSSENGELVRVDPDSYEPDDDAADYTLIDPTPFLGAQNHTLHSGTDLDWYRFYGYTDRNYHFYSTGTIDTDIYLYLDDGTTLLNYNFDGGEGTNYDLYFTPPANAYYKIKVVGYNAVGAYVFCYHHVADPDAYEPDDDASSYTPIASYTFSYDQSHTLHNAADQDWYRFEGISGMTYSFWSTGHADTKIFLYEDNGTTLLDEDDDDGELNNYNLSFTPTVSACYKLKVVAVTGWIGAYHFYSSYTAPADSYEPDDSSSQLTYLSISNINQTQDHTLHVNSDQDWFRFQGYPGACYTFYSTYSSDTIIYLYDDNGTTLLAWDDESGDLNNFKLEFTPTANALYKLKVVAYENVTGYYGFNYSYNAYPDSFEPDNTAIEYTTLTVTGTNQTQNHTIHSAEDQDWFLFYGYAGLAYAFYSHGSIDSRIFLYAENGTTLLDWDDDDGDDLNYSLQFAPAADNFYKVKVDGYGDWVGGYVFNYLFSVAADAYEPDNSASEYTAITPTSTLQTQSHTLHSNTEQDWFRFQGAANRVYTFYSTGITDTRIWVYDDSGSSLIAYDDDSGDGDNFALEFIPTATAYYKLKVFGSAGSIGAYGFCYANFADLTAPANLTISFAETTLTIQWNAVAGAVSYQIEASADPFTGFTVIGATGSTSWTGAYDPDRRFYRIRASDSPVP